MHQILTIYLGKILFSVIKSVWITSSKFRLQNLKLIEMLSTVQITICLETCKQYGNHQIQISVIMETRNKVFFNRVKLI